MTTYNPFTGKLESENETRREMIRDSIRELRASQADIMAEDEKWFTRAFARNTVSEIERMVSELKNQLAAMEG